jgi:hypothetical protein
MCNSLIQLLQDFGAFWWRHPHLNARAYWNLSAAFLSIFRNCCIVIYLCSLVLQEYEELVQLASETPIYIYEWVSDCCSTPIQLFFSYIMARTGWLSMRWWWILPCSRPTRWVEFFIVLAHWNNSPWVDMSFHSDTLLWFRANQSLLFLLNAACLAEKQQIPIL